MIHSLGYVGFGSPRYEQWERYGTEVLGCQYAGRGSDDAVRLRIDDFNYRIAVHPSERDEVAYIGWTTVDEQAFTALSGHLTACGVQATAASADLLEERQVAALVWFVDPWGNRHEVSWGKFSDPSTFNSPRGIAKFVTGSQGLGHIVLLVPDVLEADAYFTKVLGLRLSDRIVSDIFNLRFYHFNGRHHTLALGEVPNMTGFNHLMLEVANFDDLGKTIDLVNREDTPVDMMLNLGRHTNDLMTSIYISTPSSFQIEYGYGGFIIDDADWVAPTYTATGIWGHSRSELFLQSPPGILNPFKPDDSQ